MRVQSNQAGLEDGVFYFLSDHRVFRQICLWVAQAKDGTLRSTALTLDEGAGKVAELRYSAWGETRYTDGSTPTQRRYTGQLEAEAGLYFYQARWYDPGLGRFAQADSIIPLASQGVQAWDRYAYVNNNPVIFTDPSGHIAWFATAAIGAVIGGIIGGTLYYFNNPGSFNWGECGAAAGAGLLAGGLIGSGVGLLAAPATSAALASVATAITGAGAGVTGSAIGYTITNQDSFDTLSFVETTTVGGIVGGISAAIPINGLGVAAKGITHIAGAETLYALQTNEWTVEGAQQAAMYGVFSAGVDVRELPCYSEFWVTSLAQFLFIKWTARVSSTKWISGYFKSGCKKSKWYKYH